MILFPFNLFRTLALRSEQQICYFLMLIFTLTKDETVGTTKLTRKEIMAEDPVHEAIVQLIELFRVHGTTIALIAGSIALLGIGTYFGLQYFDNREVQAQRQLARGIEFYHAEINSAAQDDPYGKGITAMFRTERARDEAASKEFSSIVSKYGYLKLAVVARYYLGLTQLKLGQDKEAIQNLQSVSNNSRDRMVGYLAKKVLAAHESANGNYRGAQEILQGMIQDPKCELLKEDLKIELSRALAAQGKRDEAIKVLREARDQAGASMIQSQLIQELTKIQSGSGVSPDALKTIPVRP
jgi:predicted negative regulator of RcsB-dependent stress response